MKKTLLILCLPALAFAQGAKVQTAFRNLEDYNTSKDVASLMKAKEAIDLATNHEDTKEKAKTWSYRTQIYYALFKNDLANEEKKLADVANKSDRTMKAYGNVATTNYEEAGKAMQKAVALDKDKIYQQDYGMVGMQMMGDVNNLAVGKYNVGKYGEAMEFFEGMYEARKMMGKKDTAALTNSLVCAQKAKDNAKIKYYDQKMIDEKVATAYTFNSLHDVKLMSGDTAGAFETLKLGRAAFPNDLDMMNREIEHYLRKGKDTEALANIDVAIQKAPNNALLYLVKGNIFDKQANPKDATGKEKEKPKNFDELMGKAETNYRKATELDPKNSDAFYNLGALYNNWGGIMQKRCDDLIKQATKMKECEAAATDKFNKAIPPLETALNMHPDDKSIMVPLRKLYLMTNQPEKAQKMSDMIKAK
ncbi:MAG: tetratricopeptide repeat protein [Bacteroidia bacterium]